MNPADTNLDPKIKERCDALSNMGLLWNGEVYILEDITVDWLYITTFTDDMFGGLCGMIRARISTDMSDRVFPLNEIKMAAELEIINKVPNQFPSVVDFASGLLRSLDNGEINPLDLALQFKALAEIEEMVKPRLRELATAEADKFGKGDFSFKGAKMKVQEMGTRYDYSGTGDIVYTALIAEKAALDKKIKAREDIAKSAAAGIQMVDEATGEVYEIYPPIKKSTTTLVISLK